MNLETKNLNLEEYFWEKTPLVKEVLDFLKDLIIIIIFMLIIRSFIILPFQISWQSMYESYYDREFIIVDRLSYVNFPLFWDLRWPQRWDAVVFNTHIKEKEYFIKRIIALPWETLKIKSWSVFVKKIWSPDFVKLDEKYLSDINYNATYVNWDDKEYIYTVPEKSYFVMWDNRNASTDSRACFSSCEIPWKSNFIKKSDLVWRVFIDLWFFDITKFKFVHPTLWIDTKPKFLSSPWVYKYE